MRNSFIITNVGSLGILVSQSRGFTSFTPLKLIENKFDLSRVPRKSFGNIMKNNEIINKIQNDTSLFSYYKNL